MGKGKRNCAIVISSSDDEEDKDLLLKTGFRFSKSAPTRKNPKRAKRVSLSSSCSKPFQYSSSDGFDEVHFDYIVVFCLLLYPGFFLYLRIICSLMGSWESIIQ